MSLILAVEPDRRRGRQLTALVRRFTQADIVVAQSGAAAISAMGNRVPDLILTPALLPTQDETAITSWVRELGDASAHVQTLAVPILAEAEPGQADGGGSILGRLLDRGDAGVQGHGCEPSVFADQIKAYLDRAAADRAARKPSDPAPAAQPAPPAIEPPVAAKKEAVPAEFADFEEISLDSLVLESLFVEPPATPHAAEPETRETHAQPADEPRDAASLRTWERELGLGGTSGPAPALWRVAEGLADTPQSDSALFDPSQTRFKALVRRLDEIVAQHALRV